MKKRDFLKNIYIFLVFLFLFLPILVIILFSFNTSSLNIVFEGFYAGKVLDGIIY